MDFNLVSKNNLGAATALLLVIILSQSRFFNFLLDTALGRAILILLILFISYTNKILGVVSVLFIIIMFNNSNIGYMEGATTMSDSSMSDSSTSDSSTSDSSMKKDTPIATVLASASANAPASASAPVAKKPATMKKTDTKTTPVEGGSEGFDLLGTERNVFNKKSNTIPSGKTTSTGPFEAFSGSYNQYSQY